MNLRVAGLFATCCFRWEFLSANIQILIGMTNEKYCLPDFYNLDCSYLGNSEKYCVSQFRNRPSPEAFFQMSWVESSCDYQKFQFARWARTCTFVHSADSKFRVNPNVFLLPAANQGAPWRLIFSRTRLLTHTRNYARNVGGTRGIWTVVVVTVWDCPLLKVGWLIPNRECIHELGVSS